VALKRRSSTRAARTALRCGFNRPLALCYESKKQQIKGLAKQISGKVQKGVGDVEQSVEDFDKR
jgi:hypothetical protein